MASIPPTNSKRVMFKLHKLFGKTLPTRDDALDFLPIANLMERLYATGRARREEVEIWVESGYLKPKDAVVAFSCYSDYIEKNELGVMPIDWNAILQRYSDDRIDASQSVNELSDNHRNKINRGKTAIQWLKENHPNLKVTHEELQEEVNQKRRDGIALSTQEKWVIAMKQILAAAISLEMISGTNPAEGIRVRRKGMPRVKPDHKRHNLPDSWIKTLLSSSFDMLDQSEQEERIKVRKADTKKSKLSHVTDEQLATLPDQVSRKHLRMLLDVGTSTLQRYMADGLIPYIQPNRANADSRQPDSTIDKSTVIEWVIRSRASDTETFYFEKRPKEKLAMRGMFPLAFRLGLFCGLRNSEIVWLPWDHVDLEARILKVTKVTSPLGQVWSPKSDKEENDEVTEYREIGLVKEIVDLFKSERERLEEHGLLDFFVFPSGNPRGPVEKGKPHRPTVLNQNFQKLLRFCGYPTRKEGGNHTFYSLRHSYATGLLREGEELKTVQERMGHADIRTTQHYLHAVNASEIVEDRLASRWSTSETSSQ